MRTKSKATKSTTVVVTNKKTPGEIPRCFVFLESRPSVLLGNRNSYSCDVVVFVWFVDFLCGVNVYDKFTNAILSEAIEAEGKLDTITRSPLPLGLVR